MSKTPKKAPNKVRKANDPLYQLFEHFLLNRSYDSANQFTKQLAENYMAYLDSSPAHMPFEARQTVLEDLATEAHEMLVKRMYGCFTLKEQSAGLVHNYRDGRVVEPTPLTMPTPKATTPDKP